MLASLIELANLMQALATACANLTIATYEVA